MEAFIEAQVCQARRLLDPNLTNKVTMQVQSKFVANIRMAKSSIYILLIRKDKDWNLGFCCLCHNLVQGVPHVGQCVPICRIDHENDTINGFVVIFPGATQLQLT